ncbi:MAG TPA: hypothetical protein VHB20_01675 [Verrucomicrobiae bacterium]|jgi:hypothetical protein|nr:hypothetical protein [Verrucomicrobiae bacterium]
MKMKLLALLLGLWVGGAARLPAQTGIHIDPQPRFREDFVSPEVGSHQGYATDGNYHYIFDTMGIYKRLDDKSWTLEASNAVPFRDYPIVSHFGDGDYYQGKLYLVAEVWAGCTNVRNQSILVYDAGSLELLGVTNISAQSHEVSGLVIVPEDGKNGVIYVTSYCDGSQIFKYDLATFAYLGSLKLSGSIPLAQGIAYGRGVFYVPSDIGHIYSFTRSGKVSRVYTDHRHGSHEGLAWVKGSLRWLIDEGPGKRFIHYLTPIR